MIYNGPAYNDGSNWGALCLNGYEEDSLIYTSSAKDTLCGANKAITNANIPNSVTSIGNAAFYYCSDLTSVTIPNFVTSIGDKAFYYCSGLTSVTIPNSVTSIGNEAFSGCSGLSGLSGFNSVTIPNSVTSIGNDAFSGLPNLIYNGPAYNDGKNWGALCLNGYVEDSLLYTSSAKDTLCGAHKAITNANIPNSVTSIWNSAFSGCTGLTSVTIGNSVTSIWNSAFYGCSGLTSVTIPNSVTSIGDSVFYNCRGLTSVTIGDSVTSIGNYAFYDCIGLTSVTIPNSVTSIGDKAFLFCRGLTSVTIGNSVTSIGFQAISFCRGLTSITIPNSVTSIEECAFMGCIGLTSVTFLGANTSVVDAAFNYVPDSMLIYVPCGSLSWYSSQSGLSGFSNNMIEQFSFSYKYIVSSQDTIMGNVATITTPTCTDSWTILATANYGYYFTQWSDGDTTNPRSIQVLSDTNITAEFNTNAYQLRLYSDTTQGTVIGGGVYKYSSTAIISATANYGYHFTRWSDGDTTNPRTIQVLSDTILISYFTKETTGIEEVSQVNNAVHLYPNPAKTMLTIENATENVQIFDIAGRVVMNIDNKETNMLQINISHLSKGMYFVKVGNYTIKFVKE